MDVEVTWSPQVRDDLHGIGAYIAKDSPGYASAVIEKILGAGRSLQILPWRGRVVPEIGSESCRDFRLRIPADLLDSQRDGARDCSMSW